MVAKSGYNVTLMAGAGAAAGPNDCNGVATQTTFYATAVLELAQAITDEARRREQVPATSSGTSNTP